MLLSDLATTPAPTKGDRDATKVDALAGAGGALALAPGARRRAAGAQAPPGRTRAGRGALREGRGALPPATLRRRAQGVSGRVPALAQARAALQHRAVLPQPRALRRG